MPSICSGEGNSSCNKFSKLLPLTIRKDGGNGGGGGGLNNTGGGGGSGGGSSSSSESKELTRVTVIHPNNSGSGSLINSKEVTLRLTNDENPLFFFHFRIGEGNYPEFKMEQQLLCDFQGFPNYLIGLLEKCEKDDSGGGGGPKFVLVMKSGVAATVLDIVESNPLKYLCHLSLSINPGTDEEVKKFLADVTTTLKKDCSLLRDQYNHLRSTVETEGERWKEQMDKKNEEIATLRDDLHAQANSLSTKYYEDMTQEKEKLMRLQRELADKFEQDRGDLERKHGAAISAMEHRISSLESENRDLLQTKYKNETTLQEFSNKIRHSDNDLKLLQQELAMLRKQNEKLDHDYHDKQRLSTNLQNRVTNLETDLREKQGILQKNHEQILQSSDIRKKLEEHVTGMVEEVERVKTINKKVTGEVFKANEIIQKLQDDIRTLNTKSKLQGQVLTEQERVIQDRDKTVKDLENKIELLNSSLSSSQGETTKLTTALEDAESKISSLEEKIKSNENMIAWLNKQLNEFQGLSNLSKFRQNLALSAHQFQQQQNPSSMPNVNLIGNSPLEMQQRPGSGGALSLSGGRRFGNGITPIPHNNNNNNNNTSPPNVTTTPSWMHIYQSTSTPLEDDLASRLEKISTNPTPGMNYNDLKSRFSDPYETANANKDKSKEEESTSNSNKNKTGSNARPPTWARGRGTNRVTLELGGGGGGTKGILRR